VTEGENSVKNGFHGVQPVGRPEIRIPDLRTRRHGSTARARWPSGARSQVALIRVWEKVRRRGDPRTPSRVVWSDSWVNVPDVVAADPKGTLVGS